MEKKFNDKELEIKIVKLLLNKKRAEARKFIESLFSLRRTRAYDIIREIERKYLIDAEEKIDESIEKLILELYSSYDGNGMTLKEIARTIGYSESLISRILKKHKFTHGDLPVLDDEYLKGEEEEIVKRLIESKKKIVHEKFSKQFWESIQRDAEQWAKLQFGMSSVVDSCLKEWEPPHRHQPPFKRPSNHISDQEFIIGLSDLHFGAFSQGEYSLNGKDWGIEDTCESMDKFRGKIADFSEKRSFSKCHVAVLGDILDSPTGFTDKGTLLDTHPKGTKQFRIALESLTRFFEDMLVLFPEVNVHCAFGNHAYIFEYMLFVCLEKYFRNEKRILFNIAECRWNQFEIKKSAFIMEHGYSSMYKSKVPHSHGDRERYISALFLRHPSLKLGSKHLYFLSADKHHVETKEYNNFEFYQFSTLMGGSQYADNNNWSSRPRQNGLVVSEDGVEEFVNFYLE